MSFRLDFHPVFAAWESLLDGLIVTLILSGVGILGGLAIGVSCAAIRVYGPRALGKLVAAYVEILRNTPLLVQLFLIFFGLASLGLRLNGITAAMIALIIYLGAYTTEIVRAGFEAIPATQLEAGASLGLSGLQVFRYVVLFPALQTMIPSLISQFVFFMLGTAAVSQIAVSDLFHAGSIIQSRTFRDFEVYIVIGTIYLVLAFVFRWTFTAIHRYYFRNY